MGSLKKGTCSIFKSWVQATVLAWFLSGSVVLANDETTPKKETKEIVPATVSQNTQGVKKVPGVLSVTEFLKNTQKEERGLVSFIQKENKWFLMLERQKLQTPLWFSVNIKRGVGSPWLYSNSQGPSWLTYFRLRPNNMVQLAVISDVLLDEVEKNSKEKVLMESEYFTEGLLWSGQVIAEDSEYLIFDATALLFADHAKFSERLETHQKTGYALDLRSSSLLKVEQHSKESAWEVEQHWYVPKLNAQSIPIEGASVSNSLLPIVRLSFMALPEQAMRPRKSGAGVGYFNSEFYEKNSVEQNAWQKWIHRWRLEPKEDLSTMVSGDKKIIPKEAIPVYVCPNVPKEYEAAVGRAVSHWAGAFESAGWSNALSLAYLKEGEQPPLGKRRLLICWYVAYGASSAFGPSKVDPRSGEILEARVLIPDVFIKTAHDYAQQEILEAPHKFTPLRSELDLALMEQSLDLETHIPLDYPKEGRALIEAYIEHIVTHELGHALGLRHNFKATSSVSVHRLEHSAQVSESVMDYVPMNVFAKEWEHKVMRGLGSYDLWATEYGYRWFANASEESEQLAALLKKSKEDKALGYASDEHLSERGLPHVGVKKFDLSSDPLALAKRRIDRVKGLIDKVKKMEEGIDLLEARRVIEESLGVQAQAQESVLSLIGATKDVQWERLANADKRENHSALVLREEQVRALKWLEEALIHPKRVLPVDTLLLQRVSFKRSDKARQVGSNVHYYAARERKIKEFWIAPFLSMQMLLNIQEAENLSAGGSISMQEYLNIGTMILYAPKALEKEHLAAARVYWLEQIFARLEESEKSRNGLEPVYLDLLKVTESRIKNTKHWDPKERLFLEDKWKRFTFDRSANKK